MVSRTYNKTILSLAVALGLSLSSGVMADGSEMDALYDRIDALEAQVQALLKSQQPTPTPAPVIDTAAIEAAASQAAEAKTTEILAQHKAVEAEKEHKHNYKFGGYVKADAIYSDYDSGTVSARNPGRDFYIPALIPVGDGPGQAYTDFAAKESRIWFRSDHEFDNGAKVKTYIEMDAQLSPGGDERISNSYNPRIRHAFFSYNKWTFGQTWATFFNVGVNPENLDFVGPSESTLFVRQVQVRYTNGPWMFALENPETTITPYGGGGRIIADTNMMPDAVVRYNMKGDWGTFTIAGIARELAYENKAAGINDSTYAMALSLSGKIKLGEKDDFMWMASAGDGMGRYFGLNLANGAVLDASGNLEAISSWGIYGSYRHWWNTQWRTNLTLGYASVDNDTRLTGYGVTSDASSLHLNLLYSPVPKMTVGVELIYADREIESGDDGNMTRFQFSAKYGF